MLITTSLSFTLLLLLLLFPRACSPLCLLHVSPPCARSVALRLTPHLCGSCHRKGQLWGAGDSQDLRQVATPHPGAALAHGAPMSLGAACEPGADSPYQSQIHFPLNIPSPQPWKLVGGTRS